MSKRAVTAAKQIDVDYVARVEGEGAIRIRLPGDGGQEVTLRIFEPPRFFEGFLVGRRYDEVGDIVSRICGICPVSHMTTAIRAVENAMGIQVSDQTRKLRRIMSQSQVMASHVVHLYALAMPDYYGHTGVSHMLSKFAPQLGRLVRMKRILNELTAAVGGRALHPIAALVGGFTSVPSAEALARCRTELSTLRDAAIETARMVASWEIPDLRTSAEFVALRPESTYPVNEGRIVSTNGVSVEESRYYDVFEEGEVSYSMARSSRVKGRGTFMSGALARVNLNFDRLSEAARALAKEVGFTVPSDNPFNNNLAQAIEIVHGLDNLEGLLEGFEPKDEDSPVRIRPGEGSACTEAPRGLLHHRYAVNRRGIIEKANIVSPTAHHWANLEADMRLLVAQVADRPHEEIKILCEKLVRAYDPCFSCSVH